MPEIFRLGFLKSSYCFRQEIIIEYYSFYVLFLLQITFISLVKIVVKNKIVSKTF